MRYARYSSICFGVALFVFAFIACASRYYLMVDYQLPAASEKLKGQKINLQVKDAMTDKNVFTPAAARRFGVFRNHYNLTVVSGKERMPVGPRDLQGLFQDAFEKRLTHSGAQIVPSHETGAPLILITIRTVQVDVQERKWIARVVYDAELFIENQLVTRETLSGHAERVRIVGADNVDETMSDITTEIINRLDIVKFLQQGKLL